MMLVERVAALHEVDLFSAVPGRMLASVAATAEEVTVERARRSSSTARSRIAFTSSSAAASVCIMAVRFSLNSAPARQLESSRLLVPGPRSASVTAVDSTLL
jgi:hypothetical protein